MQMKDLDWGKVAGLVTAPCGEQHERKTGK